MIVLCVVVYCLMLDVDVGDVVCLGMFDIEYLLKKVDEVCMKVDVFECEYFVVMM